jgi:hypothetical protein
LDNLEDNMSRYRPAAEFLSDDYTPTPPADWPEPRKNRFRAIVAAQPAGWWTPSSEPLLREYVCALEACETLQRAIDNLDAQGLDVVARVDEIGRMLTARDRESKRAIQLARVMRLAQQSVAPTAAARALERGAAGGAPWLE